MNKLIIYQYNNIDYLFKIKENFWKNIIKHYNIINPNIIIMTLDNLLNNTILSLISKFLKFNDQTNLSIVSEKNISVFFKLYPELYDINKNLSL